MTNTADSAGLELGVATPTKFLAVYKDEDGWYRFNIRMSDDSLLKSGEYAWEVNAERDRAFCMRENSVSNIETTEILDESSNVRANRPIGAEKDCDER